MGELVMNASGSPWIKGLAASQGFVGSRLRKNDGAGFSASD
ncbi:hypothetical protein HMPREF3150_01944 [Pseudomonas aeruginosa]|nr:hypothetical protein HMPREF3150_01944 [Pseudomonas aeruginosa]